MQEVEFVGSGRSEAARARKWVWIGIAVAFGLSALRTGINSASLMVFGGGVAALLLVDRLILRRMRAGQRVALLDANGIESPLFSTAQKRYAWNEIVGATTEVPHNVRTLQLQLKPMPGRPDRRSFWNGANPARPQFALSSLAPQQQEELLQLVLERTGTLAAAEGGVGSARNELRQERLFKAQLEALAPVPWLTWTLVAVNVAVWLGMTAFGGNGMRADTGALLEWGGNSAYEVVERGDWWRLLTATFLHGGLVHLAMNMIGLASAGVTVERLYGRCQYALIYFGSALVGSALSLHFSAQRAVSVGASGAVFGVAVAMLVALYTHRKELPRAFSRQVGGLAFFILYSLLQGFGRQGIDNAAHVGGLLAGAALAWLLPRRLDPQRFAALFRQRAVVGVLAVVAGLAALGLNASAGVDHRQLLASLQSLQQGLRSAEAAERALTRDQEEVKQGRLTELQLDERGRTVHAPAFRAALEPLQAVRLPADDPRAAFAADALRMVQLVTEMLAMESNIVDGKPVPARPERFQAQEKELQQVVARMREQAERFKSAAQR